MNIQLYCNIWEYSDSWRAGWLNEFAWQKIPVKPLKICVEGKVTAMYCALTDKLKIADDLSDEVYFGSVIHELYHAYQRHTTTIRTSRICTTTAQCTSQRSTMSLAIPL